MRYFYVLVISFFMLAQPVLAKDSEVVFTDLDGKEVRIADYADKWVVVNFWATWCPPCREEMPDLVDFHQRHKDKDAVVLGVHFDNASEQKIRQFMNQYKMDFPVIPLDGGLMSPIGPVTGLPTTYLFNPKGKKVARQTGPITSGMIEAYMENNPVKE